MSNSLNMTNVGNICYVTFPFVNCPLIAGHINQMQALGTNV